MGLVSSLDPVSCGCAGTRVNFPRNAWRKCLGGPELAPTPQKFRPDLRKAPPLPPRIHSRTTH